MNSCQRDLSTAENLCGEGRGRKVVAAYRKIVCQDLRQRVQVLLLRGLLEFLTSDASRCFRVKIRHLIVHAFCQCKSSDRLRWPRLGTLIVHSDAVRTDRQQSQIPVITRNLAAKIARAICTGAHRWTMMIA